MDGENVTMGNVGMGGDEMNMGWSREQFSILYSLMIIYTVMYYKTLYMSDMLISISYCGV